MSAMIEKSQYGWRGGIAALLAGMALPLAFSPFNFYPVAVLSLSVLFLAWHDTDAKQAAWRGFLFGFDTAVISGGEQAIQKSWNLGDFMLGQMVGMALYGTILGAIFGGIPADKYGRRTTLFWVARYR